jgi:hypothetical protein
MSAEEAACTPIPINPDGFNVAAELPYGLQIDHIRAAMADFVEFIGFINTQMHTKGLIRLESMLMPANFSSMVGEFMSATIPRYCSVLVKNKYHNGHPDLVPTELYPGNAILHGSEGIEVKASRRPRGWQGHNPEDVWLMVFVFDSNRPVDTVAKPFRFVSVAGARIEKADWKFAGRTGNSRRTITATVTPTGYAKMMRNWIYRA